MRPRQGMTRKWPIGNNVWLEFKLTVLISQCGDHSLRSFAKKGIRAHISCVACKFFQASKIRGVYMKRK